MSLTVIKAERHTGSASLWIAQQQHRVHGSVWCFTEHRVRAATMPQGYAQQVAQLLARQNPGWVFITENS